MVTAVVGAGGKTTYIHEKAGEYRAAGYKVLVTTTTHMYIEKDTLITDNADIITGELKSRSYCMAGNAGPSGKISALSYDTYKRACSTSDIVLVEADGSRQKPLKYPAEWEPVIPDNANKIVVVMGLEAIGKKCRDVVHRYELAEKILGITGDTVIEQEHIDLLITKGYIEPLKRKHPDIAIEVHLNDHDSRTMSL